MKKIKSINLTTLFVLLILLVPLFSQGQAYFKEKTMTNNEIIFRDDFNNKSSHWRWIIKQNANVSFNEGIAEFTIPNARFYGHFDAEIMDVEKDPYKYGTYKTRIKVDPVLKGSRGWGFWNGLCKKSWCNLAWFIYQKRNIFYPFEGLYVQCANGNPKEMSLIPIEGYDISEWHNYTINWRQDYVEFYIDNELVESVTKGVPTRNCRTDVWIDNANWLLHSPLFYLPISNRFNQKTTLYLDYVEITS